MASTSSTSSSIPSTAASTSSTRACSTVRTFAEYEAAARSLHPLEADALLLFAHNDYFSAPIGIISYVNLLFFLYVNS